MTHRDENLVTMLHRLLNPIKNKVHGNKVVKLTRSPKRSSPKVDVPSISIYGVELPNELTNIAYIPVCEPYVDTPVDVGIDKFGGKYLYKSPEMTEWPICDTCTKPLMFIFNIKDPLYDPKLDVGDHVQCLMCINANCSSNNWEVTEHPYCKLYRYNLETIDKSVFEAPATIPCFKVTGWKITREPEYFDMIKSYIMTVPGIENKMRDAKGFTDWEWKSYITDRVTRRNEWSILGEPIITPHDVLVEKLTDEYYEEVIESDMIYNRFKFGGTPGSITGGETYDNYIQISKEPFFPYEWDETDEYVLHVSRDGSIKGDMDK